MTRLADEISCFSTCSTCPGRSITATALDTRREGLTTIVIADATLPVRREGGASANADMRSAGAEFVVTSIRHHHQSAVRP